MLVQANGRWCKSTSFGFYEILYSRDLVLYLYLCFTVVRKSHPNCRDVTVQFKYWCIFCICFRLARIIQRVTLFLLPNPTAVSLHNNLVTIKLNKDIPSFWRAQIAPPFFKKKEKKNQNTQPFVNTAIIHCSLGQSPHTNKWDQDSAQKYGNCLLS